MASYSEVKKSDEREEFPETYKLEMGSHVVAIGLKLKRGVETKYGERDVLEVIIRGDDSRTRSLWWPRKLDFPPMQTPFLLANPEKNHYRLLVPETPEEMQTLWEKGELANGQALGERGMSNLPAGAEAVLKKFKKG